MVEVIWNLSRNHSLVWVVDGGQERNRTSTGLLPLDFESSASTVPPLALRNYCVVNFQSPISNHWILGIGYYGEAVLWWAQRVSNPRQLGCKPSALPTELCARKF